MTKETIIECLEMASKQIFFNYLFWMLRNGVKTDSLKKLLLNFFTKKVENKKREKKTAENKPNEVLTTNNDAKNKLKIIIVFFKLIFLLMNSKEIIIVEIIKITPEYIDEIFTNWEWIKITKHNIKDPNKTFFDLIEYSSNNKQVIIKQKILSNILKELIPSQLIKNDWKKAWPPKVWLPIELKVLPKTEPVSSILMGWIKYFCKSSYTL